MSAYIRCVLFYGKQKISVSPFILLLTAISIGLNICILRIQGVPQRALDVFRKPEMMKSEFSFLQIINTAELKQNIYSDVALPVVPKVDIN